MARSPRLRSVDARSHSRRDRPPHGTARRLLIDLPGQAAEEWIVDDLLIELGIFAAVLPRIVDERTRLGDARRAEGVGLDDVGAGLKKPAMKGADHLR